jgi:hypothetical protein
MSERHLRRCRGRFEEEDEAGLIDRRLGNPSPILVASTQRCRASVVFPTPPLPDRNGFPPGRQIQFPDTFQSIRRRTFVPTVGVAIIKATERRG